MKLSDAIRRGAALRPQGFGDYFDDRGSCALGAAIEAITGNLIFDDDLWFDFPELECIRVACPADQQGFCPVGTTNLEIIITHLNDGHRWPREAIADWLDSISVEVVPSTVVQEAQR